MSMFEIQATLKAPKCQFNSFGKYRYRSCEDILEAAKPVLAKFGYHMNLSDKVICAGDRIYIEATATVLSGAEVIAQSTAYAREPEDKKGMDASQITGTASSYARKYALNGLFAIDDTKDADTDEHKKQTSKHEPPELPAPLLELPAPTPERIQQFNECGDMDGLQALWMALDNDTRHICAKLKDNAKARLQTAVAP
tara:strand:- start:2239 stop:2829 length:591 start_codon:yes stop_codon:yes gene_type:complete